MKEKKIPLRKCAVCGEQKAKTELIRVVRTPEGDVVLDRIGKQNGRGAYMCRSTECLKKAKKSGRLSSSLGVALSEEIYDELAAEVADGE
ncbi:MAG: YlxR family protein [Ruminococcaceae bacterium]|nr:YlxR family protein [Oscillospiraceae bacterium]MBO4972316.1 YlxR family protein [Clostridia bacterium]